MKTGTALPMKIQIEDSFIIQPSDDSGVVMNADSFGNFITNKSNIFIIYRFWKWLRRRKFSTN